MNRKTLLAELRWAIAGAAMVFAAYFLANEAGFSPEQKLALTLVAAMPFFMQFLILAGLLVLASIVGFGWLDDRLSDWVDERAAACELKEQL